MDTTTAKALADLMQSQQESIRAQHQKTIEQFQENYKKLREIMYPSLCTQSTPVSPASSAADCPQGQPAPDCSDQAPADCPDSKGVPPNQGVQPQLEFSAILRRLDKIEDDLKLLKLISNSSAEG